MKVALIGASGNAGSRLLKELSDRGHEVTAIARDTSKIAALPHVTPKVGDVYDHKGLIELLKGHDAVISAVHFTGSDTSALLEAVKASGVPRYLVVGGAGSLEVAPGVTLVSTPNFPPQYKAEAEAGARFLQLLKGETQLNWTYLSPSAFFQPGARTGQFRLGGNELLTTEKGSSISFEDFAMAMVDELEKPRHSRQRFTVGY